MYRMVFILLIMVMVACQPEPSDVPFRLELRTLQLEVAIIEEQKDMVTLLSDEVAELYKEKVDPKGEDLNQFNELIRTLQETEMDDTEFTHLQKLKELIISIPIKMAMRDEHLDALMVFGNHLLLTTETARDVMMDLYEWNEFTAQAEVLEESWKLLEDREPSMELLRFNEEKVIAQKRFFDLLRQSINEFFNSVEEGDATTYDLCSNADVVRQRYIDYLKLLTTLSSPEQEEILE